MSFYFSFWWFVMTDFNLQTIVITFCLCKVMLLQFASLYLTLAYPVNFIFKDVGLVACLVNMTCKWWIIVYNHIRLFLQVYHPTLSRIPELPRQYGEGMKMIQLSMRCTRNIVNCTRLHAKNVLKQCWKIEAFRVVEIDHAISQLISL